MASAAYDTLDNLMRGEVIGKKAPGAKRTRSGYSAISSVVKKAPEVMVKVTGNGKGAAHAGAHLEYITRNGKLELEDENGGLIIGKKEVKALLKEWMENRGNAKENTRDTTHIILSMPKGVNKEDVKKGARGFSKKQFGLNHQYAFALHDDTDNPHVHLVVRNLGFDNKRLHVKKGDPQKWRETFASELNKVGVNASATHRTIRGVIKKGTKQAVHQIRQDENRLAKTDVSKKVQAAKEYQGKYKPSKPWEKKISERQTHVRKVWLQASKDLAKSTRAEDRELSKEILTFVNDMPPMKTERHEMLDQIKALHQQQKQPQNQNIKENQQAPDR